MSTKREPSADPEYVDTGLFMAWVGVGIFVVLIIAMSIAYYIGHLPPS